MNVGNIITKALNRAKMSVGDIATREMALDMLDEVIQQRWSQKKWNFRKTSFSFQTATNVEQYGLHKLTGDTKEILENTMLGTDPVRTIRFKPSTEFYRQHPHTLPYGSSYEFRDAEIWGVQTQPSAASQITITSNLANYTTGTLTVVYGSRQVIITGGSFTLDMLGRWLNVGTDTQDYRLSIFVSSTIIYLDRPYEGASASGVSFKIGDVHQKVTVQGFATDGTIIEEQVKLNGTSQVTTNNLFAALNRISKSERTYGTVKATSNSGLITNIILDPGETEADFPTIKMFPIPAVQETINYEAYARHPYLYRDSDSPLLPSQYHPLILLDLYIKLMTEFLEKPVQPEVIQRRDQILEDMIIKDNDMDNWKTVQEQDYESVDRNRTNLPENYGVGYAGYGEYDIF